MPPSYILFVAVSSAAKALPTFKVCVGCTGYRLHRFLDVMREKQWRESKSPFCSLYDVVQRGI